jgi:hypothetical protein
MIITSIVISVIQKQCLNLGEVSLYFEGSQVSPASLDFRLASIGNYCDGTGIADAGSNACHASFCNDANPSTICHGSCSAADSLTIELSQPTKVDQILITNRLDGGHRSRLNGANVVAYLNGTTVWRTTVPRTSAYLYQFQTGE